MPELARFDTPMKSNETNGDISSGDVQGFQQFQGKGSDFNYFKHSIFGSTNSLHKY